MHKDIDEGEVNELCRSYTALLETKEHVDAALKDIREKLDAISDGRDEFTTAKYNVRLKRVETWKWDEALLKALKDADAVPGIDLHYKVERKTFDTLNDEQRKVLRDALTVRLGRIDAKVERLLEEEAPKEAAHV